MFKKLGDLLNYKAPSKGSSRGYYKKGSFDFLTLIENWEQIVGEKLAQNTVPLKNQNKVLTILTHHPAYSQQLSFMEEAIKEKIFKVYPELMGSIKRLNFQASTTYFHQQKEELQKRAKFASSRGNTKKVEEKKTREFHPYDPKVKVLRSQALKEFEHIEDEFVKEKMISIFIQSRYEE